MHRCLPPAKSGCGGFFCFLDFNLDWPYVEVLTKVVNPYKSLYFAYLAQNYFLTFLDLGDVGVASGSSDLKKETFFQLDSCTSASFLLQPHTSCLYVHSMWAVDRNELPRYLTFFTSGTRSTIICKRKFVLFRRRKTLCADSLGFSLFFHLLSPFHDFVYMVLD